MKIWRGQLSNFLFSPDTSDYEISYRFINTNNGTDFLCQQIPDKKSEPVLGKHVGFDIKHWDGIDAKRIKDRYGKDVRMGTVLGLLPPALMLMYLLINPSCWINQSVVMILWCSVASEKPRVYKEILFLYLFIENVSTTWSDANGSFSKMMRLPWPHISKDLNIDGHGLPSILDVPKT